MALENILQLEARRLCALPGDGAAGIRCLEGSLWLTLDNDPRDIVLEAGDSFEAPAHRRCLLYALEPARFVLQPRVAADTPQPELATAA